MIFFLLLHKEGYYLKIKENKQLYFFLKFIDQISLFSVWGENPVELLTSKPWTGPGRFHKGLIAPSSG